jgi:SNARE protein 1
MVKSRLETDFRRLLRKCELLVAERDTGPRRDNEWRLEKYVEALEDKLEELRKLSVCQPGNEELAEYKKKVKFLKGVLEAEKLATPSQKLMATQILSPVSGGSSSREGNTAQARDKTREIYLQTQAKYANEIREELLGLHTSRESQLNRRLRPATDREELFSEDVDAVLRHHHNVQEKVAQEMVSLAQNLKQNVVLANHIIRKDVETLEGSSRYAEANSESLKQSNDKLGDFVRRSCQYWLWIMLALVSLTFLWIVVFIRMFPKKVVLPIV